MTIIPATPAHAADIAQLIMTAMTEECCQYLAGKEHTLDDFYHMMLAAAASLSLTLSTKETALSEAPVKA